MRHEIVMSSVSGSDAGSWIASGSLGRDSPPGFDGFHFSADFVEHFSADHGL